MAAFALWDEDKDIRQEWIQDQALGYLHMTYGRFQPLHPALQMDWVQIEQHYPSLAASCLSFSEDRIGATLRTWRGWDEWRDVMLQEKMGKLEEESRSTFGKWMRLRWWVWRHR